ncbi:MAG: hypothetical protein AAF841_14355, partial [Pseudomonadota bacterium]
RAIALGAAIGAGLMAKYAMVYFVLCAGLVWVLQPAQRVRLRDAALAGGVALMVFTPNILWNLRNDAQTVRHLVEENAQVGRVDLNWGGALGFVLEQAVAFGPLLFVALFYVLVRRPRGAELTLLLFCVSIIAIVTGQALASRAFGNWAATAYIAAPILAASVLQNRRGVLMISQVLNMLVVLALPLLAAFPDALRGADDQPLLKRYLGLHAVSEMAALRAAEAGLTTLSSHERALLADFFYTLDDSNFDLFAWGREGDKIGSWYHAEFLIARPLSAPIAYLDDDPPPCAGARDLGAIEPAYGAWAGRGLRLWELPAGC